MTYPKAKLDASDPAGWYECDSRPPCGLHMNGLVRRFDGQVSVFDGDQFEGTVSDYTNFRPLSLTPTPEVVDGEMIHQLPRGNWIVLGVDDHLYLVRDDGSRMIQRCHRALRIPDAWLAALKSKPAPVVTDKHREAARKLAEVSPNDDAELLREYQRILAESFPAEVVK